MSDRVEVEEKRRWDVDQEVRRGALSGLLNETKKRGGIIQSLDIGDVQGKEHIAMALLRQGQGRHEERVWRRAFKNPK
jgi:hypothetical protein